MVREARTRRALLTTIAVAMTGCANDPITGVHLTVMFPGLEIDQIRFTVTPQGGDPIVARRPELTDAGVWLTSPQDVLVYLPDYLAGRATTCQAAGMAAGTVTPATGTTSTMLALHELVPATITLAGSAVATDGGGPPPPPPPPMPKDCAHHACSMGED
jgi:hypothetical protein